MNLAIIEIKFRRPRADLDDMPAVCPDYGGHIYRIRNSSGRLVASGSCKTLDRKVALDWAIDVAKRHSFTHYVTAKSLVKL